MVGKTIKLKVEDIRCCVPEYATNGSNGADLRTIEDYTLRPGETKIFSTGFRIRVPKGYVGLIFSRSGLGAKHGIVVAQGVGVIDQDFSGILRVPLRNQSKDPYLVSEGDAVAQIVFVPCIVGNFVEVQELSQTERGDGGFGSTGR